MPDPQSNAPQRPSVAAQLHLKWLIIAAKWTGRALRRFGIGLLVFGRALYDPAFAIAFNRGFSAGAPESPPRQPATPTVTPAVTPVPPPAAPPATLQKAPPDSALLLLGLLQKDARLLDFLQQEVGDYSDQQVGAAARVVHQGCRRVLKDYLSIAPVRTEPEGGRVTLQAGFDPEAVHLSGQLVGGPPFRGTLVHGGWRATEVRLPQVASGRDLSILAPAEVEL
ncbi:DUF2760 domain-containing protein [uncultured Thiodictyon sp.]|uniref:DUF2760 domain-containing protein n=1 Tax=uncultured Thiodictyon sp. TaxID=1846217 RepID=UPI0025E5CD46|nr:DUF2760 domain-containing protein [uncultured Thiodictyon sp.]